VSALSGYDQTLVEDSKTSRLEEDIALFQDLIATPELQNVRVFLLLNKLDLFTTRLKQKPMLAACPNYDGGEDVGQAVDWIKRRFLKVHPTASVWVLSSVSNEIDRVFEEMTAALIRSHDTPPTPAQSP